MAHTKVNYVLVLLFALSVTSCKRMSKEYTTVEFKITNPADGSPFVGVPVQLIERVSKNNGIESEVIWEGKTDSNGRIRFEFQAMKTSKYWYTPIIDESYFGPEETWTFLKRPSPSAYTVIKDIYNEIEYEITYFGFLREIYVNVNCENSSDSLYVEVIPSIPYGSKGLTRNIKWGGCTTLSTSGGVHGVPDGYFELFMGQNTYNYKVVRESGITYGKDSIFIEKGMLNEIEIKY